MSGVDELRVLVVGLGAMGRGIARVFDRAGAAVRVIDATPDLTEHGIAQLDRDVADDGEEHRITAAGELESAAAAADFVIEAVSEDLGVKYELFGRLGAAAGAGTIVASNTSSLSIGELARAFGDPSRVVGAHYFNPPTKMRLVEVVRGPGTSDETVERVVEWAHATGKTPIVCDDSPNFIVNRVCRPLYMEAQLLLTQGLEPAAIDTIAREALGHRMGPLELLDFAGLHVNLASSETALRELGDPRYRPIPYVRRLVRAGYTGRAQGRGFYDYSVEDPRTARGRVTIPAPAPAGPVAMEGPGAEELRARLGEVDGLVADRDGASAILYACGPRAVEADVEAVRDLAAAGATVVVESSDGRWIDALPAGAGWLRLHAGREGPFAEVVDDAVAGIRRGAATDAVLGALGARSVNVLALPGLVADRLRHTLVNEAALVLEEGVAEREAIDVALRLGMNHPEGPFEYLDRAGAATVVGSLRSMLEYTGDPRYRPTLLLCRQAGGAAR